MPKQTPKPMIVCLPNGPYYLLNDMKRQAVPNLRRADGKACATVRGVALCRCGGSKNKPFCDGTHGTNGFKDKTLAKGKRPKRTSYEGKRITIHDDRSICAHAGVCTERLKSVFRGDREPWIDPDGAGMREIVATIKKCPSGALSYSIGGVAQKADERRPLVTVTKDGPYAVTGGVALANVPFADGASPERYTLCRCGASRNKPFCDGSHWSVGFKDG